MATHKLVEAYLSAHGQKNETGWGRKHILFRVSIWLLTPILAPMLESRWLVLILAAFGVGQLALAASGYEGWRCPINYTLDVPCPGCGLTRAVTMLFQLDWAGAVRMHAFAPLVLVVLSTMFVAGILPTRYRNQLTMRIASLERQTGFTAIGLICMIAYWTLRLVEII